MQRKLRTKLFQQSCLKLVQILFARKRKFKLNKSKLRLKRMKRRLIKKRKPLMRK